MTGSQSAAAEIGSTTTLSVKRIQGDVVERVWDVIAVEAPLAIHVTYWSKAKRVTREFAITMRTPGNDAELATGYLLGEGIVQRREDIAEVQPIGGGGTEIRVELSPGIDVEEWRHSRVGIVTSACGVCGKGLFEALPDVSVSPQDGLRIDRRVILELPERMRARQPGFAQTGGLHAAAQFSESGVLDAAFEDVGRHNALDKLIGYGLQNGAVPLTRKILFLSSRASFELVQKTAAAGAAVLATVGGPSSLAIEAARRWNVTLLGFVRDDRYNAYAGEWRIESI